MNARLSLGVVSAVFAVVLLAPSAAVPQRSESLTTVLDIEYGRNVHGNPLLLDAYPASAPDSPVLLVVHGGSWDSGDKQKKGIPRVCEAAVTHGYLCFAPNFTLSGEAPLPAQVDDLQQAVEWAQANAASYNGDATRIAAWGLSSGAHLGLLLVYLRPGVDAFVSWSAPTDLEPLADRTGVKKLLGCNSPCPDRAIEWSPVHVAHAEAPPTYIGHATNDRIVPFWQAERLRDRLASLGVPFAFVVSEKGHGKGLWVSQRNTTFAWLAERMF